MEVLYYNDLDTSQIKQQYEKVIAMLQRDDFYSAEVKKITGTAYYRAKLDYTNRLLFKVIEYLGKKYALILEIIYNHAYEKSRFLNGALINESKIIDAYHFTKDNIETLPYINQQNQRFHILDKIISFDEKQEEIFCFHPPVVIIGSAGSGKTMLTLEKLKTYSGEILYVTNSPYLVRNAHDLYYAHNYNNEDQEIDFLSYREFLETIKVPMGKELNYLIFAAWLSSVNRTKTFRDANKLYEEFKGVLTGSNIEKNYLSREEYLHLGIKQSIYALEERPYVYDLFVKYLKYLNEKNFYDINLISHDYFSLSQPKYDLVIVDEVQDFTNTQLFLILKTLKLPQNFLLCGDSNQIVHPNFFSWSKIKSLFYNQKPLPYQADIIRILHKNYRNTPAVTAVANKILKLKNLRFGSIDKESHYLVESHSKEQGAIYCLLETDRIKNELNKKTGKSMHFAVVVLRDDLKSEARQYFQTPLIFSIHEIKGLEYENIILYGFITNEEQRFREIARGVTTENLQCEFTYARGKDKTDRSLEIYKFYVNALYVAITRAIKNVYLVEKIANHPLFNVLSLPLATEIVAIENQESTLEEWQQEARRLELQGKQEQAQAIHDQILHKEKVPWEIITCEKLTQIQTTALDATNKNKEARLLLFEYALVYQLPNVIYQLADLGFAPAFKVDKGRTILENKYFMFYTSSNTARVMQDVNRYGIDFRNLFNQTPLMVASNFGNDILVKQLLTQGANPYLMDNLGRNAWQIALQKALRNSNFAKQKFAILNDNLPQESLSVQVADKLIKLDTKRMEFLLIQAMLILSRQEYHSQGVRIFNVDSFLKPFANFPETAIPAYRKKRAYLSSILSKHEINRNDIYNRRLFLRVRHGYYVLNPELLVKIGDDWIKIKEVLQM